MKNESEYPIGVAPERTQGSRRVGGCTEAPCNTTPKILLVDSDPHTLWTTGYALLSEGYHITTVSSGEVATELLSTGVYNLMILALQKGMSQEMMILKDARKLCPQLRVIMLADERETACIVNVLRFGFHDCLVKPFAVPELLDRVRTCLASSRSCGGLAVPAIGDEAVRQALDTLTVMSHDVRGALVSIGAGLQLLSRGTYGAMDASAAEKLAELRDRVKGLIDTSEEFLEKAFSFQGDGTQFVSELDLHHDVVNPVITELIPEIEESGVLIENGLSAIPEHWLIVRGEKLWLKSVVRNLLRNAIKYGGHGAKVDIGFQNGGSQYRLSITNSGQPVPEEMRESLFQKYSRLSAEDGKDGLGLGLYLVKDMVEKQGGEIRYEAGSESSSFVLSLPRL